MWSTVTDGSIVVYLSVCHDREPWKNCSTDRYAIWVVDSGWAVGTMYHGKGTTTHVRRHCGPFVKLLWPRVIIITLATQKSHAGLSAASISTSNENKTDTTILQYCCYQERPGRNIKIKGSLSTKCQHGSAPRPSALSLIIIAAIIHCCCNWRVNWQC